jgi:hypothetical protein
LAASEIRTVRPSGRVYALRAGVVVNVARTVGGLGIDVALKLSEDAGVGLADDVGQGVEAPGGPCR